MQDALASETGGFGQKRAARVFIALVWAVGRIAGAFVNLGAGVRQQLGDVFVRVWDADFISNVS